jgi:hypothetical protein
MIGVATVAAATVSYSPGQTIRVPFHTEAGTEATTIEQAKRTAAGARALGYR